MYSRENFLSRNKQPEDCLYALLCYLLKSASKWLEMCLLLHVHDFYEDKASFKYSQKKVAPSPPPLLFNRLHYITTVALYSAKEKGIRCSIATRPSFYLTSVN